MDKSPAQLLGELDQHAQGLRNRRLVFVALPLVVILVVYAVMADAVVKRSAELEAKQDELANTEGELAKKQGRLPDAAALTEQALKLRPDYQPSMILKRDIDDARTRQVQQVQQKAY